MLFGIDAKHGEFRHRHTSEVLKLRRSLLLTPRFSCPAAAKQSLTVPSLLGDPRSSIRTGRSRTSPSIQARTTRTSNGTLMGRRLVSRETLDSASRCTFLLRGARIVPTSRVFPRSALKAAVGTRLRENDTVHHLASNYPRHPRLRVCHLFRRPRFTDRKVETVSAGMLLVP